jgi:hypothetical protein
VTRTNQGAAVVPPPAQLVFRGVQGVNVAYRECPACHALVPENTEAAKVSDDQTNYAQHWVERHGEEAIAMAKTNTTTLTPEDQEAAREAAREAAAQEQISAGAQPEEPGLGERHLIAEERDRAAAKARKDAEAAGKTSSTTEGNGQPAARRSKDQEAKDLGVKAKALAGVKSPYSPKEGRQFLDGYKTVVRNGKVTVTHGESKETLELEHVEGFAKGSLSSEEDKKLVAAAMRVLGKDTDLWGRKLASFIVVAAKKL